MAVETHVEMHADHTHWSNEIALWREDIALWQKELARALGDQKTVQATLEEHNKALQPTTKPFAVMKNSLSNTNRPWWNSSAEEPSKNLFPWLPVIKRRLRGRASSVMRMSESRSTIIR